MGGAGCAGFTAPVIPPTALVVTSNKAPLATLTRVHTSKAEGVAEQTKEANWQTLTAALLAAGGGGLAGYTVLNKLYDKWREKKLQQEMTQAQEEYLDMLGKAGAVPAFDECFDLPLVKSAGRGDTFPLLDVPMGVAALGLIMGAGGTAYLTKRMLDEATKDDDLATKQRERRLKLRRIVFRTDPVNGSTGQLPVDTPVGTDVLKAATAVFMDIGSGEPTVLGHAKVAKVLDARGITAGTLYKEAGSAFDALIMRLTQDEDLRAALRDAAAESHPALHWVPRPIRNVLPGVNRKIDAAVLAGITQGLGPGSAGRRHRLERLAALTEDPLSLWGGRAPVKAGPGFVNQTQADALRSKYAAAQVKTATLMDSLLGNMLGTAPMAAAQLATQVDTAKRKRAVEPEAPQEDDAARMLAQLELIGADPRASEFIRRNRTQIYDLLTQMAARGELSKAGQTAPPTAAPTMAGKAALPGSPATTKPTERRAQGIQAALPSLKPLKQQPTQQVANVQPVQMNSANLAISAMESPDYRDQWVGSGKATV